MTQTRSRISAKHRALIVAGSSIGFGVQMALLPLLVVGKLIEHKGATTASTASTAYLLLYLMLFLSPFLGGLTILALQGGAKIRRAIGMTSVCFVVLSILFGSILARGSPFWLGAVGCYAVCVAILMAAAPYLRGISAWR